MLTATPPDGIFTWATTTVNNSPENGPNKKIVPQTYQDHGYVFGQTLPYDIENYWRNVVGKNVGWAREEIQRLDSEVAAITVGSVPDASTVEKGKIEIATQSETNTGSDAHRAITPATLSTYVALEVDKIQQGVSVHFTGTADRSCGGILKPTTTQGSDVSFSNHMSISNHDSEVTTWAEMFTQLGYFWDTNSTKTTLEITTTVTDQTPASSGIYAGQGTITLDVEWSVGNPVIYLSGMWASAPGTCGMFHTPRQSITSTTEHGALFNGQDVASILLPVFSVDAGTHSITGIPVVGSETTTADTIIINGKVTNYYH